MMEENILFRRSVDAAVYTAVTKESFPQDAVLCDAVNISASICVERCTSSVNTISEIENLMVIMILILDGGGQHLN